MEIEKATTVTIRMTGKEHDALRGALRWILAQRVVDDHGVVARETVRSTGHGYSLERLLGQLDSV